MAMNGFFAGGLAEGIDTAQKQALAERAQTEKTGIAGRSLDIQQQAQDFSQQAATTALIDTQIAKTGEAISEAITKAHEANVQPSPKLIGGLISSVVPLFKQIGRDPGPFIAAVQAKMANPTAGQAATGAGQAEASKIKGRVGELSEGGTVGSIPNIPSAAMLTDKAFEEFAKKSTDIAIAAPEAQGKVSTAIESLTRLEDATKELADHPGLKNAVGLTKPLSLIPGTDAAAAASKFESIKSQITLTALTALREASKTGGGLGNISNYEDKMLASSIAALKDAQSYADIKKELAKITKYTGAAKERLADGFKDQYGIKLGEAKYSATPKAAARNAPPPEAIAILRARPDAAPWFEKTFPGSKASDYLGK